MWFQKEIKYICPWIDNRQLLFLANFQQSTHLSHFENAVKRPTVLNLQCHLFEQFPMDTRQYTSYLYTSKRPKTTTVASAYSFNLYHTNAEVLQCSYYYLNVGAKLRCRRTRSLTNNLNFTRVCCVRICRTCSKAV